MSDGAPVPLSVSRRRLYLMRHAEVVYFGARGGPVDPDLVELTPEGVEQARRAAAALEGIAFDRVIASSLPRALQTARIVAPGHEPEAWPELREVRSGRLAGAGEQNLEPVFSRAFAGAVPLDEAFLGGETFGALVERVATAVDRLRADAAWDIALAVLHGGVNRAILSYALTGERRFFGNFEQAPACINVLDVDDAGWIVRAVNVTPYDLCHLRSRATTMEELWAQFQELREP